MFERFEKRFGRSAQCRSLEKLYCTIRNRKKEIVWDGNNTVLHLAILSFEGDVSPVEILLEHDDSGINVRNSEGETPLHLAVQNDRCSPELIELLLKHGADVKASIARDDNTALHLLAISPMSRRESGYAVSKIFLELGIDPNARNLEGCIPLHYAAQKETFYLPLIVLLLEHGSNVCMRNSKGDTPLHLLLRNKKSQFFTIRWFLKKCPDVNIVNSEGETPLHVLARNERRTILVVMIVLLSHGADVRIKDKLDKNAYQAYNRFMDENKYPGDPTLRMLLQGYKYVNSSLHVACLYHDIDSVHRLLKLGADVNAIDTFDYPPLFYAVLAYGDDVEKRSTTLRLLFDFGANVNHKIDLDDFTIGRDLDNWMQSFSMRPITYLLRVDKVGEGLNCNVFQAIRPNDCPAMLDIFFQHLAKLLTLQEKQIERGMDHLVEVTKMTRDLHNDDYLRLLQQDDTRTRLQGYYNDCLSRCSEEVKSMSETEIGGSGVSFLDLLLANAIDPAIINTKNKELVKAFHAKTATFPLYQGMLDAKIDKVLERQKLIESAAVSMSDALQFADPSDEFFVRTLSYCSNKDLINLIDGLDVTKCAKSVSNASVNQALDGVFELL